MRIWPAFVVVCIAPFAHATRLDVMVDLHGHPDDPKAVAEILGAGGKVLVLDEATGTVRVELRGELAAGLERLRKHPKVKSADPAEPILPPAILEERSARVLRAAMDDYHVKYKAYRRITAPPGKENEEVELPGLGHLEAYLFFVEERAYPNDVPDWPAWAEAAQHRDRMEPWVLPGTGEPGMQGLNGQWQFLGPRNLATPYRIYYGLPPLNGRINGVAYDPITPTTFYVIGAQGGIWKTVDNGVNWTPLSDKWEVMAASAVAVHPTDPNTIYVGTGDYPGSRPYCMGVMKSTDGGATWTNLGRSQLGSRAINKILIDPVNPQIILVTQGRGTSGNGQIWRSTNGGSTWSAVISTSASWSDLTVGAPNLGVRYIYAVGGDSSGGKIFRSQNQGSSWTQLSSPVSGTQNGLSIAASKIHPNTVYLLCPSSRLVFKSTNAGANWTNITAGFVHGNNNYNWSQGSYDFFMDTSWNGSNDVVYTGLIDVVMSPDGGSTWQSIGGPTYVSSSVLHNDQHSIAIHPTNPNVVLIGGDGGIFRYTYNPATNTGTWGYLSANLGVTQFYKSAFHPTNPSIMLGGTQDNATPFCNGNLNTWNNVGGGDGGFCAINWLNPSRQYAEAQYLSLYRTTNSWSTSSGMGLNYGSDRVAFIAPFILDPNNPALFYCGTNYLYRWTDGGSWENRLGGQELCATGNLRAIAIAQGDASRIYTGASNGEVWMSQNAGATWTQINTGSPGLPNRVITSISVSPSNPSDVLVTVSGTGTGHVWRCTNTLAGTRVWQDVSGSGATGLPNVPANMLARDISQPTTVWYVATDVGVFATGDSGATWHNATAPLGLPNTQVNDIKTVPGTGRIVAATYGRGMWSIQVSNLQTVSGTIELQDYSSVTARDVVLRFYNPGSTTPIYTASLPSAGVGPQPFSLNVPLMGTYDVSAQGYNWLRKRVANITITPVGAQNVTFSLINGDVDGNNEIDIADFAIMSIAFGRSTGQPGFALGADLDGDGTIDIGDYAILSMNYGLLGDD